MDERGEKIDAFPSTQPLNGSSLWAYDVERSLSVYEFRKSHRRCPLVRLLIILALSFLKGGWADTEEKCGVLYDVGDRWNQHFTGVISCFS